MHYIFSGISVFLLSSLCISMISNQDIKNDKQYSMDFIKLKEDIINHYHGDMDGCGDYEIDYQNLILEGDVKRFLNMKEKGEPLTLANNQKYYIYDAGEFYYESSGYIINAEYLSLGDKHKPLGFVAAWQCSEGGGGATPDYCPGSYNVYNLINKSEYNINERINTETPTTSEIIYLLISGNRNITSIKWHNGSLKNLPSVNDYYCDLSEQN